MSAAFSAKKSSKTKSHVERTVYPSGDPRANYNFNGKAAALDIQRKQRLSKSDFQAEESQRPSMHARVCNIIVSILMSLYPVDDVVSAYSEHIGLHIVLTDHLNEAHKGDPTWSPSRWSSRPELPFILVAQAIYDDTSASSFPKKLSTLMLARLAADNNAITAFVYGIFPPPPVSAVPQADDFPVLPIPAALPPQPFVIASCNCCAQPLSQDFSCPTCTKPLLNMLLQLAVIQQQQEFIIQQNYNMACNSAMVNFQVLNPIPSYFNY